MLVGAPGLVVRRATTPLGRRVAVDVAEERLAAVGDAVADDEEGASLARRSAGGPTVGGVEGTHPPEAGGGGLGRGLREGGQGVQCSSAASEASHFRFIGRTIRVPIGAAGSVSAAPAGRVAGHSPSDAGVWVHIRSLRLRAARSVFEG